MTKPDLVALADLLAAIEPLQDWTAQLHPKPEKYDRYVAVLTKDQRDAIVQSLRHLASQPSLYDVVHALNEWADLGSNALQWLRNIKQEISTPDEASAEMAENYRRVIALSRDAISGLPADGGDAPANYLTRLNRAAWRDGMNDIQNSDGGVEGHAASYKWVEQSPEGEAHAVFDSRSSSSGQAGIKPGPSEATPSTAGSVREALSHLHFMAENQSAREFTVCDCVDEWRSPARNAEDVCTLSDLLEKHGLFIATADQQEKSAPVEAPVAGERDLYGEAEQWGMQYVLHLFGKHVAGIEAWEAGDGSESVDGDILAEFDHIAKAAGWINADGDPVFGPRTQPSVEEIARIVCYWDQSGTCHDNYCVGSCQAVKPDEWCFKAATAILTLLGGSAHGR